MIKQYIVDAFTDKIFHGNPAAICVLDKWPTEKTMINMARENNLSETAFTVREGSRYHLRWFTPAGEIDLCGHATLACAFVLLKFYEPDTSQIAFQTQSGTLTVRKQDDLYEMDFPAYDLTPVPVTQEMIDAIGAKPIEAYMGRDLLCIFEDARTIRELNPDQKKLLKLEGLLLHATAKAMDTDCISRSFAPKCNIAEDPVCGSGHCHIAPYWAKRLGKKRIIACQASQRGGTLYCQIDGNRVKLAGKAVLYSIAEIHTA